MATSDPILKAATDRLANVSINPDTDVVETSDGGEFTLHRGVAKYLAGVVISAVAELAPTRLAEQFGEVDDFEIDQTLLAVLGIPIPDFDDPETGE